MEIPPGATAETEVTVRNTRNEPLWGVTVEVDYGGAAKVRSAALNISPGQEVSVPVRLANSSNAPVRYNRATVRVLDSAGRVYQEQEHPL